LPTPFHDPIRLANRVYFGDGTGGSGMLQIVERENPPKGNPASPNPFAPTAENILYAQLGRLDAYPPVGSHTTFPVLGMEIPEFAKSQKGKTADIIVMVNESTQNECRDYR